MAADLTSHAVEGLLNRLLTVNARSAIVANARAARRTIDKIVANQPGPTTMTSPAAVSNVQTIPRGHAEASPEAESISFARMRACDGSTSTEHV